MFKLRTRDGHEWTYETVPQAHKALAFYAKDLGLDTHFHTGSWAGTAVSTAYTRHGDPLFDAQAVVSEYRLAEELRDSK